MIRLWKKHQLSLYTFLLRVYFRTLTYTEMCLNPQREEKEIYTSICSIKITTQCFKQHLYAEIKNRERKTYKAIIQNLYTKQSNNNRAPSKSYTKNWCWGRQYKKVKCNECKTISRRTERNGRLVPRGSSVRVLVCVTMAQIWERHGYFLSESKWWYTAGMPKFHLMWRNSVPGDLLLVTNRKTRGWKTNMGFLWQLCIVRWYLSCYVSEVEGIPDCNVSRWLCIKTQIQTEDVAIHLHGRL